MENQEMNAEKEICLSPELGKGHSITSIVRRVSCSYRMLSNNHAPFLPSVILWIKHTFKFPKVIVLSNPTPFKWRSKASIDPMPVYKLLVMLWSTETSITTSSFRGLSGECHTRSFSTSMHLIKNLQWTQWHKQGLETILRYWHMSSASIDCKMD